MKQKKSVRNIGIKVKKPRGRCDDKKCPFHGDVRVRGMSFTGTVVKKDVHRTALVEWFRRYHIPKYERYEKRRTKLRVHNPGCIDAGIGDMVRIMECRPLSKTKNFVIVENLGKVRGFAGRKEAIEEAKPKAERLAEEKKAIKIEGAKHESS